MKMKDKRPIKRDYTEEFKLEAVRLVQAVGVNEAGRRLGVPTATVGSWARRAQQAQGSVSGPLPGVAKRPVTELEAENSRLRKELAEARMDVEILKKATAYFAKGLR